MRCAIYARYSSDLQREASIEDQIRKCRDFAARQGWAVLEEYVCADRATSGAELSKRLALQSLVAACKRKPHPFERILVDDSSRLARNLPDALNLVRILEFHGVHVTAVSQGIHSEEKNAQSLFTGLMDQQFLEPG